MTDEHGVRAARVADAVLVSHLDVDGLISGGIFPAMAPEQPANAEAIPEPRLIRPS